MKHSARPASYHVFDSPSDSESDNASEHDGAVPAGQPMMGRAQYHVYDSPPSSDEDDAQQGEGERALGTGRGENGADVDTEDSIDHETDSDPARSGGQGSGTTQREAFEELLQDLRQQRELLDTEFQKALKENPAEFRQQVKNEYELQRQQLKLRTELLIRKRDACVTPSASCSQSLLAEQERADAAMQSLLMEDEVEKASKAAKLRLRARISSNTPEAPFPSSISDAAESSAQTMVPCDDRERDAGTAMNGALKVSDCQGRRMTKAEKKQLQEQRKVEAAKEKRAAKKERQRQRKRAGGGEEDAMDLSAALALGQRTKTLNVGPAKPKLQAHASGTCLARSNGPSRPEEGSTCVMANGHPEEEPEEEENLRRQLESMGFPADAIARAVRFATSLPMAVDLIRSTTPQAAPLKPPSCAHVGNPRDGVRQGQAGNKDQVLVHQSSHDAALCSPTEAMQPDEHSHVKPLSLEDDKDAVGEADARSPYIQRLLGRALLEFEGYAHTEREKATVGQRIFREWKRLPTLSDLREVDGETGDEGYEQGGSSARRGHTHTTGPVHGAIGQGVTRGALAPGGAIDEHAAEALRRHGVALFYHPPPADLYADATASWPSRAANNDVPLTWARAP